MSSNRAPALPAAPPPAPATPPLPRLASLLAADIQAKRVEVAKEAQAKADAKAAAAKAKHDKKLAEQQVKADKATLQGTHDKNQKDIDRERELKRYADLATARARRLSQLQRSGQATEQRLSALERDEARLNELLAALERAARNAAASGGAPIPGGLTTADIGKLDWPVNGRVVYNFGRTTLPSGGVVRWKKQ